MKIQRFYTEAGKDPFSYFEYDFRTSRITNPDGSVVFEMKDVEVPKFWSQVATDILAQKYCRKKGVPQVDKNGKPKLDKEGNQVFGSETSVKMVATRLASTWRHWGETHNYFDNAEDAQAFEDELKYMIVAQMCAPNSPQWFNTGLAHAYNITGDAQGHYYIDPETEKLSKSKDAYTRPQPHACFIQSVKDDLVNEGGIFDLIIREARLFKYGSGTGTNFSKVRGGNENLSGGGVSSGLMSFLAVLDRAAGAIKSGGTTRRAAKMVCLDMDHPEIEGFIDWKVIEEQKVAALHAGSHMCYEELKKIVDSAAENGLDAEKNPKLKRLIYEADQKHIPLKYIKRVLQLVEEGMKPDEFSFRRYDTDFRSEAYLTVGGQNSNNSVRVPNEFVQAVRNNTEWNLINRTNGKVYKSIPARKLWDKIANAAWASADPGIQYDSTINEWHTCPEDGRINASNPCSEYMFLDDTACNLASINLIRYYDDKTKKFDIEGYRHTARLWTIVLEVSVLMAQFPSKEIAELSYDFRTLGLGYANIGTVLMQMGIPYTSEEGYAVCGALTAILCGESYATSAEMAKVLGTFRKYEKNKKHMLKVIRNHRRAAYNVSKNEYEGLTVTPKGINPAYCPENMLAAAREAWDRALEWGEQFGYRNAQTTVIAPTGTIGLVMDCDTTGIEPDFALVKFKKLVGGGYFKIVNQSIIPALENLGYTNEQIVAIENYAKGHATLKGCPHINEETLRGKGFTDKELLATETQLTGVFELKFAFNKFSLGEEFCRNVLGMGEKELNDINFDMLLALGFTKEQIEEANEYVCGTMTLEGAPHLKKEHYAVFDCANKCGKKGKRFIPYNGHLRMMAAAQPFISGSISKTVNMPEECTVEDIQKAYMESWELMLKCNAIYRDGSKLSQPLNTSSADDAYASLFNFEDIEDSDDTAGPERVQQVIEKVVQKPFRRKLPSERHSLTHKFSISGHEGYLTVGLYDDGQPGEIFIKMSKEGSTLSGIMDALALSISMNLQYGVPVEVLVSKFCHTRFEPAGMTGNRDIPMVKSIMDYIGRYLALKFLPKESAKKYHNADLVDRAYSESTNLLLPRVPVETAVIGKFEEVTANLVNDREHRNAKGAVVEVEQRVAVEAGKPAMEMKANMSAEEFAKMQKDMALHQNNEDAAMCSACGAVMVRNGSCYKCIDCGETSGCS
ncbi:vitamin B12-dependent ribonucleotide reductase [Candidatus Peregrinibacteria bacterium]|nr:vitamin B12-dependent ribonucleotide reductase [Candidatus Peregrinibacteria bacterium]